MDLKLCEKVFFVTGGSRGVGREIVLSLLEEGAFVATCSRNSTQLLQLYQCVPAEKHRNMLLLQGNVLAEQEMNDAIAQTIEKFGQLDGLVANAGAGISGGVLEATQEEWASQFETKISSILNVVKPAIAALKKSTSARIVIINGVTSNVPDNSMACVSAARSAVKQVAIMLAQELAPEILVNTINLGAIDTQRQRQRYVSSGSPLPYEAWEQQNATRRGIWLERFGKPSEVAPLALLLLSPLSSYITASFTDIAGGLAALKT